MSGVFVCVTFPCVDVLIEHTDPGVVPRYHGPEKSRPVRQEEEGKEGQEREEVRQEEEEIEENSLTLISYYVILNKLYYGRIKNYLNNSIVILLQKFSKTYFTRSPRRFSIIKRR